MADYAAPTGPPPPKVPEGYKAVYNDQYHEWFFVNIYTKQSQVRVLSLCSPFTLQPTDTPHRAMTKLTLHQWEKPTEPVYGPPSLSHTPPPGAPPSYNPAGAHVTGPEKLGSNNPYGGHDNLTEDERLARQLQAEEDARGSSSGRGASDGYYGPGSGAGGAPQHSYDQQQLPPRPEQSGSRGLLGKLMGKGKHSSTSPQPGYAQPQGYGQQGGYNQPQGYGGAYQGGLYGQQQPYGQPGYGGGGYGGGYPQQQPMYMQQQPQKKTGGLGAGGGAALGLGGGLLGGMMLGEAMDGGGGGGDGGGGGKKLYSRQLDSPHYWQHTYNLQTMAAATMAEEVETAVVVVTELAAVPSCCMLTTCRLRR